MPKLILIRGLPGSGKSTMAQALLAAGEVNEHCEADMWLDYSTPYSADKAKTAHAQCIKATSATLTAGYSVVVSNTFTRQWEMQPYFDLADQVGASIQVLVATGNYQNIHNVPATAIAAMRERWEK